MNDSALSLEEVKKRFVDTEAQLTRAIASIGSLESSASQLSSASQQLDAVRQEIRELLAAWIDLSRQIGAATAAIENTDPESLRTGLSEISNAQASLRQDLGRTATQIHVSDSEAAVRKAIGGLRTLVVISVALGLGALIAVIFLR